MPWYGPELPCTHGPKIDSNLYSLYRIAFYLWNGRLVNRIFGPECNLNTRERQLECYGGVETSSRSRMWPEIRSSRETSVEHREPCVVWVQCVLWWSFWRRCVAWQGAPRRSPSWCQTWGHWGSELIASPSRNSSTCRREVQSQQCVHTLRRRWNSSSISPADAATKHAVDSGQ